MKKTPSLFKRDYEGTRQVLNEVVPGSEWVLEGEGTATLKIDGTPLVDPCAIATSDTVKFDAVVIDPEGDSLQSSNLTWVIEEKPLGSMRQMTVPTDDAFHPSFKPDMYGTYKICLKASDPQGNQSSYDVEDSCEWAKANSQPVIFVHLRANAASIQSRKIPTGIALPA